MGRERENRALCGGEGPHPPTPRQALDLLPSCTEVRGAQPEHLGGSKRQEARYFVCPGCECPTHTQPSRSCAPSRRRSSLTASVSAGFPDAARIQGPRRQRLRPSDQGPRTQGCQRTPVCVRAKQSEMLEASARWPKFCFLSFLFSRFYQGVRLSLVRMLLPRWKVRALERVSQCRPKCRFHRVVHSTGSFLKGGNGRIFLNFRRGFRSLRKGLGTSSGLGAGGFGKGEKERRRASSFWLTSFGLGPALGSKADR